MIEIMLGGESRKLSTNMGALRKIKEITKVDPFKWVQSFSDPDFNNYEAIEAAINAGLQAAGDKTDKVTIQGWIDELEPKVAIEILTRFVNSAFGVEETKEPGEVKTPMHK